MWPEVVYRPRGGLRTTSESYNDWFPRYASSDANACPAPARKLQSWARSDLVDYLGTLHTQGYTYHDIGMIWGARMISGEGIFRSENPDTFNGMPVARHIIFMTDGILTTNASAYTAYGIDGIEGRVTDGNSDATSRHMQRFWMACSAAREMGIEVWVIAFGTTLTDDMRACASSNDQARAATNKEELLARFREIGSQIGALRLTQ